MYNNKILSSNKNKQSRNTSSNMLKSQKKIMLIQKLDTKQCLFHLNKVLELEKLIYGKRNTEYWKSVNSEGGRHLENEGNFWNNTR